MKKLFYILLTVLLAVLVAPYFIPLNAYKPLITSLVSKQTGLLLEINGAIKLNLFPNIHATIEDVHLSRPDNNGNKELLSSKSIAMQMELWPLLHKEIKIKEIAADQPTLQMDSSDVAFLKKLSQTKSVATETITEEVTDKTKQITKAPLPHSTLQQNVLKIGIENGNIHYQTTHIENATMHMVLTKPFDGPITAQGSLILEKKKLAFDISLGALISLMENNKPTAFAAQIKYDDKAFALKGTIKTADKNYTFSAFEASVDPWKVGGECTINMAGKDPRYQCSLVQHITTQMLATILPETSPKFLGTIFHKIHFTSMGTSQNQFLNHLNANGSMEVKNAAFAGIQGILPPSPIKGVVPDRLPIESLQAHYTTRSGVLHLTSSQMVSQVIKGNMQGTLGLINLQLGMRANLEVLPLKKLDETLANWNWRVDISGPLNAPHFALNHQESILPNLLRKENADKLLNKVLPKELKGVAPALSEGLMNLFK